MSSKGFLAAGLAMQSISTARAMVSKANAEEKNASFFREQAAFAKDVGERQLKVFDEKSRVLIGDQVAAFAKSGGSSLTSATFVAATKVQQAQEGAAIKKEANFNERLALLRARGAQTRADELSDSGNIAMNVIGGGLGSAASII